MSFRDKIDKVNFISQEQISENGFAWLKSYPITNQIYEKTMSSYNGLVTLVNSIILSNKIIKDHESIKNKK